MRHLVTFLAFTFLSVSAFAVDDRDALIAEATTHIRQWETAAKGTIAEVVDDHLRTSTSFDALVQKIQQKFGLEPSAAERIVIAELRDLIDVDESGAHEAERPARMRSVAEFYRAAFEPVPNNAAVAREYVVFLIRARDAVPDAEKRITDVFASVPDRGRVAMEILADPFSMGLTVPAISRTAIREVGVDPLVLSAFAESLPAGRAAPLFERAVALWQKQHDDASVAAAAEGAIYNDAWLGDEANALRLYRSLSPEVKAMLASPVDERSVRSCGIERVLSGHDVRLDVAAAYLLAGERETARTFLTTSEASAVASKDEFRLKDFLAQRALIAAAIDPPAGDPFEVITNYLTGGGTRMADRVLAIVAERGGYSQIAAWQLERTVSLRDEAFELPDVIADIAGPRRGSRGVIPAPETIPAKSAIESLIKAPRLVPFAEKPIAHDGATASRCDVLAELKSQGIEFPQQFHPLRAETSGVEIVAIGVSHDLDPTGEISGGGYWIARSRDTGVTWTLLYTGLREYQPYEVVVDSTLPMIRSDGLRVEVRYKDLDEESITFPPIALRAKETRSGIMLEMKWEDLERDSDHDGLTDLVEERLLTDPQSADTDGDGIPDGDDAMPLLAEQPSNRVETTILARVLENYYGSGMTILPTQQSSEGESCESVQLTRTSQRTIFVEGNPADFAGLRSSLRVVVLTHEELEAAQKKFGRMLATHISPIVIDHSGTRAWVDINNEWAGDIDRLEKDGDHWTVESVGGFIT